MANILQTLTFALHQHFQNLRRLFTFEEASYKYIMYNIQYTIYAGPGNDAGIPRRKWPERKPFS